MPSRRSSPTTRKTSSGKRHGNRNAIDQPRGAGDALSALAERRQARSSRPSRSATRSTSRRVATLAEIASTTSRPCSRPRASSSPRSSSYPRSTGSGRQGVELEERDLDALPETVVFGIRPCDAAAFGALDAPLHLGLPGPVSSTPAWPRTTVVGVTCTRADEYCFCTSVGGGPDDHSRQRHAADPHGRRRLPGRGRSREKGEQARPLVAGGSVRPRHGDGQGKPPGQGRAGLRRDRPRRRPWRRCFDEPPSGPSSRCAASAAAPAPSSARPAPASTSRTRAACAGRQRLRCWDSCGFAPVHPARLRPQPAGAAEPALAPAR